MDYMKDNVKEYFFLGTAYLVTFKFLDNFDLLKIATKNQQHILETWFMFYGTESK